jgi:hypothetical protein
MNRKRRRPPRWFVPAVIFVAAGAGALAALLMATTME